MKAFRATAVLFKNGKKYEWQSGWFDDEQRARAELDYFMQQPKYDDLPAGIYHEVFVTIEEERRAA